MKSIKILFLLFIFSFPLVSYGQSYFGIKLGGHLANLSIDDQNGFDIDLSSKFGSNFSVYLDVPISDGFSIQPEIGYISKGANFTDPFSFGTDEKAILAFNYLDLHLLGKYTFGDEEIKVFVTAGPTYGYMIKGFTKFGNEKENIEFGDNGDGIRRTEFGLNLGGGVAFPIDFAEITMDVRYLLGLSNLFDEDDEGTMKNKGFGINMGIRFPLGEKIE